MSAMKIKNSVFAVLALLGGIVPIVAIIWQVSGAVKDSITKIEFMETRISNLESVSPNAKGTDITRRLSQAESSVNHMNKELGKLKADMGRVDNNASGLGEGLAERVDLLEKQIVSLPEENEDNTTLLERLTKLEASLKKLEKRPLITSGNSPSAPYHY